MALLFARVELHGTPDHDAYVMLDDYMSSKFWERTIMGKRQCKLPYATYQATTYTSNPDIAAIASDLKRSIEYKIGEEAQVLVVQSMNWAGTA